MSTSDVQKLKMPDTFALLNVCSDLWKGSENGPRDINFRPIRRTFLDPYLHNTNDPDHLVGGILNGIVKMFFKECENIDLITAFNVMLSYAIV